MEYPKIETLYERDENTHRLKQPLVLKNRVYGILKSWYFTEKIDGTNIRVIWRGGKMTVGGRTEGAQISGELVKFLYEALPTEKVQRVFPEGDAILYGEGYGAGIQKGGGDYSPTKKVIFYDVMVPDASGHQWWLSWENTCDVASKLGLEVDPYLVEMTLEVATEMVRSGFPSGLNGGKRQAEGLVGRPLETLFDKKGHRLILKLKTKDF